MNSVCCTRCGSRLYDSAKVAYDRARDGPPLAKNMPIVVRKSDYLGRYLQYRKEVNRLDSTLSALLDAAGHLCSACVTVVSLSVSGLPSRRRIPRRWPVRIPFVPRPRSSHRCIRTRCARVWRRRSTILPVFCTRTWNFPILHGTGIAGSSAISRNSRVGAAGILCPRADREQRFHGITAPLPDSLYRCIVQLYPESPFADEARRLLGLPAVVKIADPAEESYARGTRLLQAGKSKAAIDTFTVLVKQYPSSPAAVRAMYAAGWLYENETQTHDSAVAIYERLVARAPSSAYAQKVAAPRPGGPDRPTACALEKAKADSRRQSQLAAPADSLKWKQAVADS